MADISKITLPDGSQFNFKDAAARGVINSIVLTFTNVSATFTLESTPTYIEFPYKATVALTGVTAGMVPMVNFALVDAVSSYYAPVAETYAGGIYLYSAQAGTITIPCIQFIRSDLV